MLGYLVIRRRWQAVYWAAVGLTIGGVVTLAFVGIASSFSFLGAIGTRADVFGPPGLVYNPQNPSINGFFSRILFLGAGSNRGIAAIRLTLTALTDLLVAGFAIRATILTRGEDDEDWRVLSIWIVAMILLSPVAWYHYVVLLFVPFAGLVAAAANGRVSDRALLLGFASYILLEVLGLTEIVMTAMMRVHWLSLPLLIVLSSGLFAGLVCAYISSYWFATDPAGTWQPSRLPASL